MGWADLGPKRAGPISAHYNPSSPFLEWAGPGPYMWARPHQVWPTI